MKFKRLLTVGLMALFCAGTATAASQLNSVQVTPKANTATVNLRTTGSFTHKEYRPDDHLLLVDLAGVTADAAVERTVALSSAVLKSYKLSSYTSASGSDVTRIELELGEQVTSDVNDVSDGVQILLTGGPTNTAEALAAISSAHVSSASAPAESVVPAPKPVTPEADNPPQQTSEPTVPVVTDTVTQPPAPVVATTSPAEHFSQRAAEPGAVSHTLTPTTIRDVRVQRGQGTLDVIIEGPNSAQPFLLENPDRLVVDFNNAVVRASVRNIAVHTNDVLQVRVGHFQAEPPVTRIVIDLSGPRTFDVVPSAKQVIVRVKSELAGALSTPLKPAPDPVLASAAGPVSLPAPDPVPVTGPVPAPNPPPAPTSVAASAADPVSVPAPAPVPVTIPVPTPAPVPAPVPVAASAADPVSVPTPVVVSAADPVSVPTPAPVPVTVTVPAPAPVSSPAPAPVVVSAPAPVPATVSVALPAAVPAPAPAPVSVAAAVPTETPAVVGRSRVKAPVMQNSDRASAAVPSAPRPAQVAVSVSSSSSQPRDQHVVDPDVRADTAADTMSATPQRNQPAVEMARLHAPALEQTSSSVSPSPSSNSKYTGEPISVNLRDVDLKDFFRLIHEISGLNIVLDPSVKGTVTLVLDDVPWDQALDIVLKNNQLDRELQGKVLRIASIDTLRREAVDRRAHSEAVALAVDRQTITRFLSYAKAREIVPIIKKFLTARGDVIQDERTNALIISDIPSVLPTLDSLISKLDRKSQEVEIEVRVVSATRSFTRDLGFQLGFNWGNGTSTIGGSNPSTTSTTTTGGVTTTTNLNPSNIPLFTNLPVTAPTTGFSISNITKTYGIDAILTAAETHNLAKVLSRPRVVTQSNVKAEVKQGVKIPVYTAQTANANASVSYIDAVLRLSVTPQITVDNTIFLTVDVENTQPSGELNNNYILTTQQATTQVLVTDGGTVVIGGVIQTTNTVSVAQTPWLGDIPWLGNLFKQRSVSTQTEELIFFITPKIIQT
jgi:type IV pilus assembly protein PilQ